MIPTPVQLLVSIIVVAVVACAAHLRWKAGRASYLHDLKKKHFEPWGLGKADIGARLEHYAQNLGFAYQSRDIFMQAMNVACAENNKVKVSRLSAEIVKANLEIDNSWSMRHEAEATAKLMGFGQLVDEIHAKGIPKP